LKATPLGKKPLLILWISLYGRLEAFRELDEELVLIANPHQQTAGYTFDVMIWKVHTLVLLIISVIDLRDSAQPSRLY
jgi:hypothetical protein